MDRLEDIKEILKDGWCFPHNTAWLVAEVERLRAIPEAIAQRCEQYAGPRSDSLSGGAFREAARIARELGQNG